MGTFRIVNGQKQGGNVATYFCLPDGRVLHAIAGPVDAATFLREARWVVETRKLAVLEAHGNGVRYAALIRKAHADRLREEHGLDLAQQARDFSPLGLFAAATFDNRAALRKNLNAQGRTHLLLAVYPLARLEQVYPVVFEKILGQKVSTLPVDER